MRSFLLILQVFIIKLSCIAQNVNVIILGSMNVSFQERDIWNIHLQKSQLGNTSLGAFVEVSLFNQFGQPVIKGKTSVFQFDGAKQLYGSTEAYAAQIQYFENENSQRFYDNKILDEGRYQLCVNVYSADEPSILGNNCQDISISNILVLNQIFPFDKQDISTLNPLLAWIIMPSCEECEYKIVLTKMNDKNKLKSFKNNENYLAEYIYKERTVLYPIDVTPLEWGQRYGWQVFAIKDRKEIARSDIWSFTPVASSNHRDLSVENCFRKIEPVINKKQYIFNESVFFSYNNSANDLLLNYEIIDLSSGEVSQVPTPISLSYGFNNIIIPSLELSLVSDKNYLLRIKDSHNRKYQLTFKYIGE